MRPEWWSEGLSSEEHYERRLIARLSKQLRRATGLGHRERIAKRIAAAQTRLAAEVLSKP